MASGTLSTLSFVESSGTRLAIFEDGTTDDTLVHLHGGLGVPDYLADVSAILATKDVGPGCSGRLRAADVRRLGKVGEMVRTKAPDPIASSR